MSVNQSEQPSPEFKQTPKWKKLLRKIRDKVKQLLTRDKARRQQKKNDDQQKTAKKRSEIQKQKKIRRRIFPIWLRLIVIFILCFIALMAGLMIGYGVIGDGHPLDAWKTETWHHIIDIVKGNH